MPEHRLSAPAQLQNAGAVSAAAASPVRVIAGTEPHFSSGGRVVLLIAVLTAHFVG